MSVLIVVVRPQKLSEFASVCRVLVKQMQREMVRLMRKSGKHMQNRILLY